MKTHTKCKLEKAGVLLFVVAMIASSATALADTRTTISDATTSNSFEPVSKNPGVVWDNGVGQYKGMLAAQWDPPTGFDAFPGDDFKFEEDQEVTHVHWQGGYYNCQAASGPMDYGFQWNITFFEDRGDGWAPGAVIIDYAFPNETITREKWFNYTSGTGAQSIYFNYTVELPDPITFEADTTYWLSIYGYAPTMPQAGWTRHNESQLGIKLHEAVFRSVYFGYPDWVNASGLLGEPVDFNFQLIEQEPVPILEITEIKGPIGVKATIKNTGEAKATAVDWDIKFTGGFILIGKEKNGTITEIDIGASGEAKLPLVIGFGKSVIGVNVACAEGATATKDQNATVLLIFVLIK